MVRVFNVLSSVKLVSLLTVPTAFRSHPASMSARATLG